LILTRVSRNFDFVIRRPVAEQILSASVLSAVAAGMRSVTTDVEQQALFLTVLDHQNLKNFISRDQ